MISRIQALKEKYLRGWDRQVTVILLASALLLTLHRYYSRRSFFNRHFAEYFDGGPLAQSYPYYYWFLTTAITLLLVPAIVARFGTKERLSHYGFRLGNQKLGWSITGVAWVLMIPVVILAVIVYPPFPREVPAQQSRRRQLAGIFTLSTCLRRLHVFLGVLLPWVHAFRIGAKIRELQHLNSDQSLLR